jgi:CO dehydrogenase maturation factor
VSLVTSVEQEGATTVAAGRDEPADRRRVVITGKGGVGKTSLTAVLARLIARSGSTVLAVDGDAQMNLAATLGVPVAEVERIVPLGRNADLIEEKTGARPGEGWGLLFRLNPSLDDVVERFGLTGPDGVRLLVMGSLVVPAMGCLCPENALLAAAMQTVALRPGDVVLLDTQAGIEHFGRALAKGFGRALVVAEPTYNAMSVAVDAAHLAAEMGIPEVDLVVNRLSRVDLLERFVEPALERFRFTNRWLIPEDDALMDAGPSVEAVLDAHGSPFLAAAERLARHLTTTGEAVR